MKFKKGHAYMLGKRKVLLLSDVEKISDHASIKMCDVEVYALTRAYNLRMIYKTIDRL